MCSPKIILLALLVCLAPFALAETFELTDGRTVSGELLLSSATDVGVQLKTGEGVYEKFTWAEFSQKSLKDLATKPKLGQFVEAFIEIPVAERLKKTEANLKKDYARLELPAKRSLLGSLFGSSVGLLSLLLIYGANIYAGFEIAKFRAYPPAMVCGVSAVAPFVGPIVFLCLPTRMDKSAAEIREAEAAAATAAANPFKTEPAPGAPVAAEAGGLHFASAEADAARVALPETQVFQRGQFTFNRRFLETKFAAFFSMVRRDADKDMLLIVKTSRAQYDVHRINRISANDLHAEVHQGPTFSEVVITFAEIQEMKLKHKDVP